MRATTSIRLSERETARIRAASAEAGVPTATFLREAAVEVAGRVLRGDWRPVQRAVDGRHLEFEGGS